MSFNNILQDNINAISCLKNSFPEIYLSSVTKLSMFSQHPSCCGKKMQSKSCTSEIIHLSGCISNPLEW